MKLHRFIGKFNLAGETVEAEDPALVGQISKVLRLKEGEKVILCDGEGNEALAEIKKMEKNRVSFKLTEKQKNQNEPKIRIILYCAVLKKENFELVCQKATETGAAEIVPILTDRTVKTGLNMERLQKIIKEAAEQSERGIVPKVSEPVSFEEAMRDAHERADKVLFFSKNGKNIEDLGKISIIALFIGPEGGWTEQEEELARKNGAEITTLGKLTLRAETAAIVACYLANKKP